MGGAVKARLALPAVAILAAACSKAPPPLDEAAVVARSDEVAERF
ncbi:MAG: hypothetical protein PHE36_06270 [Novosphingobium sp.]|nr:hypothetical protein [Novosphingobium sp.]